MTQKQDDREGAAIKGPGAAFDAALARARSLHARASDLLALVAHMAPGRPIPSEAISTGRMTPAETASAKSALTRLHLCTVGENNALVVTSGVQSATRAMLAKEGDEARFIARAVRALAEAYPHGLDDPADAGNWGRCAALEPHVAAVLEHAPDGGADAVATRQLLRQHAPYLFARGRLDEAEALLRRAGAIGEGVWGADHPNGAQDRTDLAILLSEMGRPEEALPLVRRAVAIDEATFGPEHPIVASRYNIMATLLANLGRHAEADPYIRHAVLAAEQSLGADHPDTRLYRENYEAIITTMDAIARRDDAVEQGLLPASPERLQRPDIPPPPARDRSLFDRLRDRRLAR